MMSPHAASNFRRRPLCAPPPAVLPLTFLSTSMTNPTPTALQPAFAAATLAVFAWGWLPHVAGAWEHPRLAAASLRLCGRLRAAQLFAEAAASASAGCVHGHVLLCFLTQPLGPQQLPDGMGMHRVELRMEGVREQARDVDKYARLLCV